METPSEQRNDRTCHSVPHLDHLIEYHCVRLQIQFIHEDAKVPYRKRPTDAGYDLFSIENATIPPGNAVLIHTGIKIAAPPGYYYTIEGRSSLWMKGIFPNRGIIDAGYIGEVVVSLVNVNNDPFELAKGDRIAQIILQRQYDAEFIHVSEFSSAYNQRGTAGFGSSGR